MNNTPERLHAVFLQVAWSPSHLLYVAFGYLKQSSVAPILLDCERQVGRRTDDGPDSSVEDQKVGLKSLSALESVRCYADIGFFNSIGIGLPLALVLLKIMSNTDLAAGIEDGQCRSSNGRQITGDVNPWARGLFKSIR